MRIPFSLVFALLLSFDTFAAPVPNAQAGDEFALEVRKAKAVAKKPVKAPVKAKPVAKKPVAKKPVAKPVAKKPVAKPAAKPAAKKPVAKPAAKPAAKKPVAKPVAKPAAKPAVKPVAKPAAKPVAKPAAKPAAAKKPAAAPAKKPAAAPAKKPTTAAPAKKPATAAKKPAAAPAKKPTTTAAKKPATAAKKPAAAPAKKPTTAAKKPAAPAKKPTTTAAAKKPAVSAKKAPTKSAAKPSASAKPTACTLAQAKAIKARELEELEERELYARVGVSHPDGAGPGTVTLFHGTSAAGAASLAAGVDLSKTVAVGDFNHKPEVPGGFYLTDSVGVAAQFACFGVLGKTPTSVDVVEYKWTGAGQKVFTFPGETPDWKAFQLFNGDQNPSFAAKAAELFKNDMIAGPLNGAADTKLTDSAQQYAVINQAAATNNLRLTTVHKNILCKNVPVGNKLTAAQYAQGQAGNAKFKTFVASLQKPSVKDKIKDKCVVQ